MNTQPRFVRAAASLAIAVAGVVSLGCAAHKPAPQVVESVVDHPAVAATAAERSASARDEQQSVTLRKGQKLVVRLNGQPPHGYAWQIAGSDWGNGVVEVDEHSTKIEDSGTAVYNSSLSGFSSAALGTFAAVGSAGDAHTYYFHVSLPTTGTDAGDNLFQGVSATTSFTWSATQA